MKIVKFKDVAHLYIGCKVIHSIDICPFVFLGINMDDKPLIKGDWSGGTNNVNQIGYCEYNEFKPILRPLSDITEAEAKECFGFSKPIEWHELKFEDWKTRLLELYKNDDLEFTPTEFLNITKLGFDLFCLIENGEAINETQMK